MIMQRIFRSFDRETKHFISQRKNRKVRPICLTLFNMGFPLSQKKDPVLTVQDLGMHACLKRNSQGLYIRPQMIDPSAGRSQDHQIGSSKRHGKADGDLRIRRILYRVVLTDTCMCFFTVVIHHLFFYTVKISDNVIRHNLVLIQEFQSPVHTNDVPLFLSFQDRKAH